MLALADLAPLARGLSFRTDRLLVRRFAPRDVLPDVEHQRHPDVMRYIRAVPSPEQAESNALEYTDEWKGEEGEWCAFAVDLACTAEYLGAIVFRIESTDRQTAEIGYRFHPDHHGHGYATEACRALVAWLFDTAQVHKIVALCATPNAASYRVMERLGMQREAHLREYIEMGGEWVDEFVYGLLLRDFVRT